jgi:hypothetical protein
MKWCNIFHQFVGLLSLRVWPPYRVPRIQNVNSLFQGYGGVRFRRHAVLDVMYQGSETHGQLVHLTWLSILPYSLHTVAWLGVKFSDLKYFSSQSLIVT